jgi:hypothetical protein
MNFTFSCKIYHTKVYTTFTKVVVLFARKLTKLVSHFSDFSAILYDFYKSLANTHTRVESFHKEDR